MSTLFSPLQLKNLTLRNRVIVSPMCQYSAVDGTGDDWLIAHLGALAVSGPGLVLTEATHVSAVGRITPRCLGLYSDDNERILARVVKFFRERGGCPIGVQLAHAGRKASTAVPWEGGKPLTPEQGGWATVGPSAIPFDTGWHTPTALDEAGLKLVKQQFVDSTKRAARIGFDVVELHGAHGYLMSEFLSAHANTRTDGYGGSLEKRMRYPLEIFEAVRGVWPADRALGVRISATEYADGGWSLDDAAAFVNELKRLGCDFVDVSGGGVVAHQKIPLGPGYQVGFAEHIKRATGMPTMAVGMITEPRQAETIVASGQADMVALARAFLRNPRWVWDAADALGVAAGERPFVPPQYLRGRTAGAPKTTPAR
jgi:2,4-dienoyl-CoA reductase-like NADH-dependent reductase (Old Yellow Enzyme family)